METENLVVDSFRWLRKHSSFLWLVSHPLPGLAMLAGFAVDNLGSPLALEIVQTCYVPWLLSGPALALACIVITPLKEPSRAYMLLVTFVSMPALSAVTFAICYMAPLIGFPIFVFWLLACRRVAESGIWD